MMSAVAAALIVAGASFLSSVLATGKLIPVLRAKKMGQTILEIGPRWHKPKEGTPSMGGIYFLALFPLGIGFGLLLFSSGGDKMLLSSIVYVLCNGSVGVLDDLSKFKKKENLGLLPWQKLFFQVIFAGLYLGFLTQSQGLGTEILLPFSGVAVDLGIAYYFLMILFMAGAVNFANLTDGIDGLAGTVSWIIALFFFAEGWARGNDACLIYGAVMLGVLGGFLLFNFHPARIFMGDTGSLFLGAYTVAGGFLLGMPLVVPILGIVFVIEGASVILQVLFFKLTGKRLFRMAPIHHHFEKKGWQETEIVTLFALVALLAAVLAHYGLYAGGRNL